MKVATKRRRVPKVPKKQGQQELFRHGGKRPGAGRPKRGARASERHQRRKALLPSHPVHVVLRAHRDIGSLRKQLVLFAIREALITLAKREGEFRVIKFSLQRNHVHLLVEARDRGALARGMQAFGISAAKHINALLIDARDARGARRRGAVFPDRYHPTALTSPRQVRNCLAYVLNNWRHHHEDRRDAAILDRFSSAVAFEGWKESAERDGARFVQPPGYVWPLVYPPTTWLLTTGWRRHGLISAFEVPGQGAE